MAFGVPRSVRGGEDRVGGSGAPEQPALGDGHSTVILGSVDEGIFRSLGVNVTSEPVYQTKKLYRKS